MAYSEEEKEKIFNTIFSRMENGASLLSVCKSEGMPSPTTIYKWIEASPEKVNDYARAIDARTEKIFEDMLAISDQSKDDIIIDDFGNEKTNNEVIQRSRLMIDTRKWMLGKMKPGKYGDKIQAEISGIGKVNAIFNIDLLSVPNNDSDT